MSVIRRFHCRSINFVVGVLYKEKTTVAYVLMEIHPYVYVGVN